MAHPRNKMQTADNSILVSLARFHIDPPAKLSLTCRPDHCLDYLRQVIMCHGDLTPIIFEWNTRIDGYVAHHNTLHTCRSFDAIFDWARHRNTSGMVIDGKHDNKELL